MEKRKTTERVTLRFTKPQMEEFLEAIRTTTDAWRGKSHHAKQAILDWARAQLAATLYARKRGRKAS